MQAYIQTGSNFSLKRRKHIFAETNPMQASVNKTILELNALRGGRGSSETVHVRNAFPQDAQCKRNSANTGAITTASNKKASVPSPPSCLANASYKHLARNIYLPFNIQEVYCPQIQNTSSRKMHEQMHKHVYVH